MKSQRNPLRKRTPKPGCFYRGLLILGYLSVAAGGLVTLGGMAGFISTFIKSASDISSALQNLDQGFALFGLTLIATYLGAFTALGCVGLIGIGLGFLFMFLSTAPAEQHPIDKPMPLP